MSIFGTIMNKIFHHRRATPALPPATPNSQAAAPAPPAAAPAAPVAPKPVDVEAVPTQMAAQKGRPSNWQTSIVDSLALPDMNSSLTARQKLVNELNIHLGDDSTTVENIALHQAVMAKLAENGGKVPPDLRG